MHHGEIDGVWGELGQFVEGADSNPGIAAVACHEPAAHSGRWFCQDQPCGLGRDHVGMQRLAATVVQNDCVRPRYEFRDLAGETAEMHVAVACVDVDRMIGIIPLNPLAHTETYPIRSSPTPDFNSATMFRKPSSQSP